MICKNCGAYFVRPPCPSCGQDGTEKGKTVETEEETTVKPSKLRGGSAVNPNIRTEEQDDVEAIPSFALYDQDREAGGGTGVQAEAQTTTRTPSSIPSLEMETQSRPKEITSIKDEEYRKKVKQTVREVIKLLEQLVED